MFNQAFKNIPDVTKNLLIINGLMFLATIVLRSQGIDLQRQLSIYYPSSPFFEPYQIISNMFMHADFGHLFFNMFGLVVFGSLLEKLWGKKRFFIFYFVTGIGATLLHWTTDAFQIYQLSGEIFPEAVYDNLQYLNTRVKWNGTEVTNRIMPIYLSGSLGASGSIYGLVIGFATLFPNTELSLIFPPISAKAKWFALVMVVGSLFFAFASVPGDNIGHVAHLGGALFGFILIRVWRKDRSNFY